jgi:hypothetical protein
MTKHLTQELNMWTSTNTRDLPEGSVPQAFTEFYFFFVANKRQYPSNTRASVQFYSLTRCNQEVPRLIQ